ncbi:hypothetical protein [Geomonas sp. Red276]
MRKLFLTTTICLLASLLITLGMRNPALEHNRGPKQRPRAVVETSVKVADAKAFDCQAFAELPPPPVVSLAAPPTYDHPETVVTTLHSVQLTATRHSRAPPA